MNGDTQERDLMAVFRGHGYIPMRSPGSGTGDWDQPDVMAARQGIVVVTELKSGGPPSNVEDHEVDALARFADAYWGAALIGIRYKGDRTFYLVRPSQLDRTPSGHYSIPSSQDDLPWDVALPYTVDDDEGTIPRKEVGDHGIVFAGDDTPPRLSDWIDAVAAEQQGFDVRRGVIDQSGID
jgi:Holliday junction resolvase